jgi:hypothetical protein
VTVSTSDAFGNPTKREDDKFTAYIGDVTFPLAYSSETHSHSFSTAIPKAGVYLYTVEDSAGLLAGGTQLGLQVVHGEADATASTISAGNFARIVSAADTPLPLQVFPRDSFGNAVPDATGFAVQVQGLAGVAERYPLEAPGFLHTIIVPADSDATLLVSFFLDGEQIDETVEISVAPPAASEEAATSRKIMFVVAGVSSFLLFLGVFFYRRHLQRAAEKLKSAELEMIGMDASQKRLAQINEELEDEVRMKKHSEEELKVMVSALEAVSKERQDELKGVMMESKELKIDRLLGKGGFGVVNLATYRGTKVAMKQVSYNNPPLYPPLQILNPPPPPSSSR